LFESPIGTVGRCRLLGSTGFPFTVFTIFRTATSAYPSEAIALATYMRFGAWSSERKSQTTSRAGAGSAVVPRPYSRSKPGAFGAPTCAFVRISPSLRTIDPEPE
jgi:hypothetical protein